MTTAWGGVRSEGRAGGESLWYLLAVGCGMLAGGVDIKFGGLLFTALLVLLSCMVVGFTRPRDGCRWGVVGGIFVPRTGWFAHAALAQKPQVRHVYEGVL